VVAAKSDLGRNEGSHMELVVVVDTLGVGAGLLEVVMVTC